MSNYLYVTEYATAHTQMQGGIVQVPEEPPLVEQKITISGSSTASNAFNAATRMVRLQADGICSVLFGGSSVTVTTSSARMIAGATEYRGIPPSGTVTNVAVITNT